MKNVLYIVRGLPGSGKSTLAKKLCYHHFEADMYHMIDGVYKFDVTKIKESHEWCFKNVSNILESHFKVDCAVSNTFTQRWEYQKYIDLAIENDYDYQIIECHGNWKNVHDVPEETLERMKKRWEAHND